MIPVVVQNIVNYVFCITHIQYTCTFRFRCNLSLVVNRDGRRMLYKHKISAFYFCIFILVYVHNSSNNVKPCNYNNMHESC